MNTYQETRRTAVQATPELRRVLGLRPRSWGVPEGEAFAAELTRLLRLPHGAQSLRPIQALALAEMGGLGGLFGPIRVGGGKTLLSGLAPVVLRSQRPLLLIPAKLIEKTKREFATLRGHWPVPRFFRIESYELLGRVQASDLLERFQPDLIVADECHRLKNRAAAVSKRVLRYLDKGTCRFVALSGTVTKRSILDYAHLLRYAVRPELGPLPRPRGEVEEWADALDEKTNSETRMGVGALMLMVDRTESYEDPVSAARVGYRKRLTETEGVVATAESFLGTSLTISTLSPKYGPALADALAGLRERWELPDGQPLADGLAGWRHARELALGFFYRWDPSPPPEWMAARKAWCGACRAILKGNKRDLDSELQVTRAVVQGLYPEALPLYHAWVAIRDSFKPNTVPVWIDDFALRTAAQWAAAGPGIVWTEHQAFAERLAQVTGLAYYGRKGENAGGEPIEMANPDAPLIASIASNAEGRNLQAFSRNLITSPPPNGAEWEQLLGRTHRDGQTADEVTYEFLSTCDEHDAAFSQAQRDARYIEESTGQAQKILYANVITKGQ